jgi:hypothetical protein
MACNDIHMSYVCISIIVYIICLDLDDRSTTHPKSALYSPLHTDAYTYHYTSPILQYIIKYMSILYTWDIQWLCSNQFVLHIIWKHYPIIPIHWVLLFSAWVGSPCATRNDWRAMDTMDLTQREEQVVTADDTAPGMWRWRDETGETGETPGLLADASGNLRVCYLEFHVYSWLAY